MEQVHILDTLRTTAEKPENSTKQNLRKRAKARFAQMRLVKELSKLDSPLKLSYERTLHCAEILIQNGNTLTSTYCQNRWCRVCNRIRTAELIKGYENEINAMTDVHFLTLTIPNVSGESLKDTIIQMTKTIRKIQDTHRKQFKFPFKAIRKTECTYNPDENNYHPHFHFLVDNELSGNYIISKWLEHYPEAKAKAQNNKPAENPIELFKYFAKLTSKSKNDTIISKNGKILKRDEYHYPQALDIIFQAMRGLRVIQTMGGIKLVSEEIEEIQSIEITDIEPDTNIYIWHYCDWINPYTGEMLSEYTPTKKHLKYQQRIRYLQT